jgi:DNA (cytosine-5)-methyltransferase 1
MIRNQYILDIHDELIVDNFAGGGGASTGIELALGRHVDIAINHDPEAVAMHIANHPQTRHFCEDVFAINPVAACGGRPVGLAWFSPDCKHFSKAKGGKPRSKKIRGLAWVMVRWAATVQPRVMILENVEEFQTWGPLLKDGSPCKRRKGKTFGRFVGSLQELGYDVEWRELRASKAGAPTIRKRLFLIARCDGRPIVWPESCDWNPRAPKLGGKLKSVRTAAECIDWSIPCPSIFERKRPLAEATLRRIARGIQKFVINAQRPFIVKVNHTAPGYDQFRGQSLDEPLQTITGSHGHAVVAPTIVNTANSKTTGRGPNTWTPEEPLRTVTSAPGFAVVAPHLTRFNGAKSETESPRGQEVAEPISTQDTQNRFGLVSATLVGAGGPAFSGKPKSLDEPTNTMLAENHTALVMAFLAKHFTDQGQRPGSEMEEPVSTITATDHNALVTANLVVQTTGHSGGAADEPLKTVACGGHHALVTSHLIRHFGKSVGQPTDEAAPTVTAGGSGKTGLVTSNLIKLKGTCKDGSPTDEPLHTVQAGGNHYAEVRAFLIRYYGQGHGSESMEAPMHTVTAKDRIGLVTVAGEDYLITDIGMRMLEPHELYAAQGFPPNYIIAPEFNGKRLSKAAQVRMCGNSVCPPMAAALVHANVPELSAYEKGEKAA